MERDNEQDKVEFTDLVCKFTFMALHLLIVKVAYTLSVTFYHHLQQAIGKGISPLIEHGHQKGICL